MRIVYMGTPDFAVPSLQILLDHGYDVVAVVTAPDKPAGRGMKLTPSPVKRFAEERGLLVLQPEKLKNPAFVETLRELKADLQVVVAFRMLPEVVWNMPPLGTLNLHGSLLPKYRGAAPINWAIINGEVETGVTTFLLQHEIDTGDILMQEKMLIGPDDTAGDIHDRMMEMGALTILATIRQIEAGNVTPIPQSSLMEATHAPKIFTETCQMNLTRSAVELHNFVRGLSPYPGAWTMLDDKVLKVLRTNVDSSEMPSKDKIGKLDTDGKRILRIGLFDGFLNLLEVQLEGKRRMSVQELLNGLKLINM
jgi:methionyl-tRNA formyltransferase